MRVVSVWFRARPGVRVWHRSGRVGRVIRRTAIGSLIVCDVATRRFLVVWPRDVVEVVT